jgi:hypothetical protein
MICAAHPAPPRLLMYVGSRIETGQIVLIDHGEQSSLIHESEDDEREAAVGLMQVNRAPPRKPFVTSSAFYLFCLLCRPTLLAGAIISIGGRGSPSDGSHVTGMNYTMQRKAAGAAPESKSIDVRYCRQQIGLVAAVRRAFSRFSYRNHRSQAINGRWSRLLLVADLIYCLRAATKVLLALDLDGGAVCPLFCILPSCRIKRDR